MTRSAFEDTMLNESIRSLNKKGTYTLISFEDSRRLSEITTRLLISRELGTSFGGHRYDDRYDRILTSSGAIHLLVQLLLVGLITFAFSRICGFIEDFEQNPLLHAIDKGDTLDPLPHTCEGGDR